MLPMGTRDSALRVKMLPMGTQGKKKKASTDGGQLFTKVALRSNIFHRPFFTTGPPLRLRSRAPDSGFAGVLRRHCRHVIHAHLLGFWKLPSLGRSVRRSVALGPSFGRSVAQSLGRSVGPSVGPSVGRSVGHSVGPSVRRSVARSLERNYICTVHTPDRPPTAAN